MKTPDVALIESRTLREQHVDHVEVLDRVKALMLLPDDLHATNDMVADYFEVGVEAIKSIAKDHLDEVEADGRRVIEGGELRSLKDRGGIDPRTSSLAVFPRRAILRVGMLLRDSAVAKSIRTTLLDVEQVSRNVNNPAVPRSFAEALRLAADLQERNEQQAAQLEADAPKVAYVDNFLRSNDSCLIRQLAKRIGMTEKELRTELTDRKVMFRTPIGNRFSESKQKWVTEYRYEPATKYMAWFREGDQPNAPRLFNNQLRTTLYVTPVGKVGIARLLGRLESAQLAIEGDAA